MLHVSGARPSRRCDHMQVWEMKVSRVVTATHGDVKLRRRAMLTSVDNGPGVGKVC